MIGSLFTGYGGLDLAAEAVYDTETAWTCDNDPAAAKVIARRFPNAPNLGDITAVDWASVPPVDIITGGFPCQDVSLAGRRAGLRPGTRSGLWENMVYAIDRIRPARVIIENVRGLLNAEAHSDVEPCPWCMGDRTTGILRALGAVLGDLANIGYDARWRGVHAADVGAPHLRFRIFIVATDPGRGPRITGRGRRSGGQDRRRPLGQLERHSGDAVLPTPTARIRTGKLRDRREGPTLDQLLTNRPEGFGEYAEAVERWAPIIGRPAPAAVINGKMTAAFVEWMMGLPAGWVTDVPGLAKSHQMRVLGNGVVPLQAAAALEAIEDETCAGE